MNTQMRTQLQYIEQTTEIYSLVDWWDAWLADFSDTVAKNGREWAQEAFARVIQAMQDSNKAASDAGRPQAEVTAVILAQLGEWASTVSSMALPSLTSIPLLPAPGSSRKRDATHDTSWLFSDDWDGESKVELNMAVWQQSMLGATNNDVIETQPDVIVAEEAHHHAHYHHSHHEAST